MKTKVCKKCGRVLSLTEFNKNKNCSLGRTGICKDCTNEYRKIKYNTNPSYRENLLKKAKIRYSKEEVKEKAKVARVTRLLSHEDSYKKYLLKKARERAKSKGILCTITINDFAIPKTCPLLGISLEKGINKGFRSDNSPSLDRIDSSKGYIPGNVWIISYRANRIKNDATINEIEMILKNLKTKINEISCKNY